jgi:hypothetical protein
MMACMDARSMVFGDGEPVITSGRPVVDDDGEWLDLARSVPLMLSPEPRPRSVFSVRLVGADLAAAVREFGVAHAYGWVTVVGTWRVDAIEVRSLSRYTPPAFGERWTTPPCPPPDGGWPRGTWALRSKIDFSELLASGAAVTVAIFWPSRTQAVIVVAASDIPAVEAALRPLLGQGLCVVHTRWSRAELAAVRAHVEARFDEWTIQSVRESVDNTGQALVCVNLGRVTPDVAAWAGGIPHGMLLLDASLMPYRPRADPGALGNNSGTAHPDSPETRGTT